MRKLTKGILTSLCAVVGFSAGGVAFTQVAQPNEGTTAYADVTYKTKDIAMMGRIAGWHGNGNFEIRLTLGEADWSTEEQKNYVGEGDLAAALTKLDLFNHIKIGDKTLAQWGCTACYDNIYWLNAGEPDYTLTIPLAMSQENMTAASNAGIGGGTAFTVLEGALIPSNAYLQGDTTATVYRAACDYVSSLSSVTYGIESAGMTDVESVKYVQGHDGTCGYFGVSLFGDDYAGAQLEIVNHGSGKFAQNRFENKILVNGQSGIAKSYGLYGLGGEKGEGYFAFQMFMPEEEMETVTIPAGTTFPTRAMSILRPLNSNNGVYMMYETQTDVTFYKQADGSWATTEAEEPTPPPAPTYEEMETEITAGFVEGTTDSFTFLKLSTHDYPENVDNWNAGSTSVKDWLANSNFGTHVLIDDVELGSTAEALLNVWGNKGVVAFRTSKGSSATKITVLAGCQLPTHNALTTGAKERYVVKEDVTFVKGDNGEWTKVVVEEPIEEKQTSLSKMEFGEGFVILYLTNNDYPTDKGTIDVKGLMSELHFYDHIEIDGTMMASGFYQADGAFINVWNRYGSIATYMPGHVTPQTKVVIKAGCQIPTYNAIVNGVRECYVTTEDITFVKDSNGEWISEAEIVTDTMKKEAIDRITNYSIAEEDNLFFADQIEERNAIVAKASEQINSATRASEISAISEKAMADIDGIQYKETVIANAKAEIEGYKADVEYREEQANDKANIIAKAVATIEGAESSAEVKETVDSAKAAIDKLVTKAEYYVTEDTLMMARIGSWWGGTNFNLTITLVGADWTNEEEGTKAYQREGDMPGLLSRLDFFNHIEIFGKTLAEWGCTYCYDNNYDLNVGEPVNNIVMHLKMSSDEVLASLETAGFKEGVPVTILEGALIPSHGYLSKTGNVVYRAGLDYVASSSDKAFNMVATAQTELDDVKYVQAFDVNTGYGFLGVSFVGDDYLGDGSEMELNTNWQPDDCFAGMVLINGEYEKVEYQGAFNLGEDGKGYLAFRIFVPEKDIISITIPAGAKFPARAIKELSTVNNNQPVFFTYELKEDITLYKTADGFGTYAEYATSELEAYKAGLFREAEEAQRATIVTEAVTAIAALNDKAAIDTIVTEAKTKIDALKTAAQYADEELAGDKAAANATIDAYKADVAYLDEQAQVKAEIIATAKAAIVAAASVEEINEAVAAAKIAIDELVVRDAIVAPAKQEVEAYKADVVYLEEQQTARTNIVTNTITMIESATSETAIIEAVANAKATIDALKTKEQVEAEAFAAAKTAANTAVDNIKKTIDFDLYEDAQIVVINGLYATVKANIAAATTEEEMNALVEKFASDIENVPTKGGDVVDSGDSNSGSSDAENSDGSGNGGTSIGCGGTVGSLACGVMMLGVAAVALLKKKED